MPCPTDFNLYLVAYCRIIFYVYIITGGRYENLALDYCCSLFVCSYHHFSFLSDYMMIKWEKKHTFITAIILILLIISLVLFN